MTSPTPIIPADSDPVEVVADMLNTHRRKHYPSKQREIERSHKVDQLARAALMLTIALTVTVATHNAANDDGPNGTGTAQRRAA